MFQELNDSLKFKTFSHKLKSYSKFVLNNFNKEGYVKKKLEKIQELNREADTLAKRVRDHVIRESKRKFFKLPSKDYLDSKEKQFARLQKGTISKIGNLAEKKIIDTDFDKIDNYYLSKERIREGWRVIEVGSLKDHYTYPDVVKEATDDSVFSFGVDLAESVLKLNSETFLRKSMNDSRVRNTHAQMDDRVFRWDTPPTTIDRYGRTYTGHFGDYGCRCYPEINVDRKLPTTKLLYIERGVAKKLKKI